jgi:protein-tyrosine phosphatase
VRWQPADAAHQAIQVFMIDIHHHLLFGIDDGSRDLETSLAMAEMAAGDGITHIACTPHANDKYTFDPEVNQQKLNELQAKLDGRITLGLGCDFHLSYDNIEDAIQNPTRYTLNHKNYLLVEFSDYGIATNMNEVFYELGVHNMIPIITHPERSHAVRRQPEKLAEWLRAGCLVQVTAGSLLGRFGKTAEAHAHQMLEKNWVHFIATDAHNLESRPPIMSKAYEWLRKNHGEETAERLCEKNPRAAYFGEQMPAQPEPKDIYEDLNPKKPSLLSRIFGRN